MGYNVQGLKVHTFCIPLGLVITSGKRKSTIYKSQKNLYRVKLVNGIQGFFYPTVYVMWGLSTHKKL